MQHADKRLHFSSPPHDDFGDVKAVAVVESHEAFGVARAVERPAADAKQRQQSEEVDDMLLKIAR